jgi:hypothetical protein
MRAIDRLYLVRWKIMITFAAYYQEPLREVATCNNKQGAKAISQTFLEKMLSIFCKVPVLNF